MSRWEKLVQRFRSGPRDFTWQELVTLLKGFGYQLQKGGGTSGSRARFVHSDRPPITLHRPQPGDLRRYQIEQIRSRQAALAARERGMSLNAFVTHALGEASRRARPEH